MNSEGGTRPAFDIEDSDVEDELHLMTPKYGKVYFSFLFFKCARHAFNMEHSDDEDELHLMTPTYRKVYFWPFG